ncbi:hypothetical protein [Sandarakinorhabdus rubra]|uniref:hypothetical protein n=1 Tax=Sandarakinorhabdus rubra TaxID=2672568 RepID=UPI0013DBD956|nr:hypothetical protein [Sandarakinorhabdus rubra]
MHPRSIIPTWQGLKFQKALVMHISSSFVAPVAIAALLALSACAGDRSAPLDAGQRMSARGESIAGRGAAWSDGQRDVEQGGERLRKSDARIADAERDLRRASDAMAKAERQIATAQAARLAAAEQVAAGTAQMRRAEADYGDIRQLPSAMDPQ